MRDDYKARAVKSEAYYSLFKLMVEIEETKQKYFYKAIELMHGDEAMILIDEAQKRAAESIDNAHYYA